MTHYSEKLSHHGRHLSIYVVDEADRMKSTNRAVRHILSHKAAPPPNVRHVESYDPATEEEAEMLALHESGHSRQDGKGGWLHFRIEPDGPDNAPIVYPAYEPDRRIMRTNTEEMRIAIGRGRQHMSLRDKILFHMYALRRRFFHQV